MRLVLGYGWRDGHPFLSWRAKAGHGRIDERALMGPLRLGIGARRCIGWVEGRQRMPCPDDAVPPTGRQCAACERRDGFRPCMVCDGFRCPPLSPAMEASCRRTHHLYLASFGGPEIKVGTASDPRRDARPIEQGPLAVARIAAGPGPTIKQMENRLSTRTEMVEGMRRSRKLALMGSGMDPEEARGRVRAAAREAADALLEYRQFLHEPVFVPQPALARRSRSLAAGASELVVDEGFVLVGEITGAIGHAVLFEEEAGRFVVDLGELVGRLVDPDPSGQGRRPVVQLGLF